MLLAIIEGGIRKWGFPADGIFKNSIYFLNDIFFFFILLFPKQIDSHPLLKEFQNWLLLGCVLIVFGGIVSCLHGYNLVGSALSFRALILLPIISFLVIPRLVGMPLVTILSLVAVLTLFNFILSIIQNHLPPEDFLNCYASADHEVVSEESGVRATGTFAFIKGLALLSTLGVWAGLSLLTIETTFFINLLGWISLVSGFGCALASISRSPLAHDLVIFAGWISFLKLKLSLLIKWLISLVAVIVICSIFGLFPVFFSLFQGFVDRSTNADDTFKGRSLISFSELYEAMERAPLGNGFGTEQIAGQYFAKGQADFNHYESSLPRLMFEVGIFGVLGFFVVCLGSIVVLQKGSIQTNDAKLKCFILITQLYLVFMFYENVVYNHTGSIFVWIVFSCALAAVITNQFQFNSRQFKV